MMSYDDVNQIKKERMDMNGLNEIVEAYIEDFISKNGNDELKKYIVPDSIPIVWFGDVEEYLKPKYKGKRIVTIAANPSDREFPTKIDENGLAIGRFEKQRFDLIELTNFNDLSADEQQAKIDALMGTLNSYFRKWPYLSPDESKYDYGKKKTKPWFDHYEGVLESIGASYRNGDDNQFAVIHIDAYTAIATSPTWSGLPKNIQDEIRNTELFKKLLEALDPDVILYSGEKNVISIVNNLYGEMQLVREYSGKKLINEDRQRIGYELFTEKTEDVMPRASIKVFKGSNKIFIYGTNCSTPFTVFNKEARSEIIKSEVLCGKPPFVISSKYYD